MALLSIQRLINHIFHNKLRIIMKNSHLLKSLFYGCTLFIFMMSTTSCQNEQDIESIEDDYIAYLDNKNSSYSLPSTEIIDSLKNVEPYEINTFDDLLIPMDEANKIFKETLKNNYWEDYIPNYPRVSRASSSRDTVYAYKALILPPDIDKKMYFKTKFSSTVVNKINANVLPEYKISTGTTYCCYWFVYYHKITLTPNQKFGYVASEKCALHPDTRSSFLERGYAMEKKTLENGNTTVELYSFELRILYKDTSKKTIYLGIDYPCLLDDPYKGYEFIYSILTL